MEQFGVDKNRIQRVRALEVEDDDGDKKPIYGVNELIEKTYGMLDKGTKQAFAGEQQYNKKIKFEAAQEIIKKYSLAAGGIAATPIPSSDIALLLPTQIAMLTHISYTYGLEITAENISKLAGSFIATAGVGFAVRAIVGNILKLVPGFGTVAGGVFNATVATGVTKLIGNAYLAYLDDKFELIYKGSFDILSELSENVIKAYTQAQKQKEEISK